MLDNTEWLLLEAGMGSGGKNRALIRPQLGVAGSCGAHHRLAKGHNVDIGGGILQGEPRRAHGGDAGPQTVPRDDHSGRLLTACSQTARRYVCMKKNCGKDPLLLKRGS